MSQKCWTCGDYVEDTFAVKCTRPYCQAKKEAGKDAKLAQQRKWAEEPGDKYDGWLGG